MTEAERNKKYREDHKDELRIKRKIYVEKNKKEISLRRKLERKRNRDSLSKKAREYRKRRPEVYLYSGAKQRAKKKNLPFDIEVECIKIPKFCPVLNIELKLGLKGFCDNSPSIDRITPDLGYVKGNIIVVSYRANAIKRDATPDEIVLVGNFYKNLEQMNVRKTH